MKIWFVAFRVKFEDVHKFFVWELASKERPYKFPKQRHIPA
jgi:capsule polysaccharide export protein KpsC/LpsZ